MSTREKITVVSVAEEAKESNEKVARIVIDCVRKAIDANPDLRKMVKHLNSEDFFEPDSLFNVRFNILWESGFDGQALLALQRGGFNFPLFGGGYASPSSADSPKFDPPLPSMPESMAFLVRELSRTKLFNELLALKKR